VTKHLFLAALAVGTVLALAMTAGVLDVGAVVEACIRVRC
jgi:hypothetical protein